MAIVSKNYGRFLLSLLNKEVDYIDDDIRVAILTSAYTPDQDTHRYFSDVVANEISGAGYTAGGEVLANKAMNYDGSTNKVTLDCDDIQWTDTSLTNARYLVFYGNTGAASTSPLICYVDLETPVTTSEQPIVYTVAATGITQGSIA